MLDGKGTGGMERAKRMVVDNMSEDEDGCEGSESRAELIVW